MSHACGFECLVSLSTILMLLWCHQSSGKILHIDFGDCFEASMNREKFPEKVGLSVGFSFLVLAIDYLSAC